MLIQIIVTIGVALFVVPSLYSFLKKKLIAPLAFSFWLLCWIVGLVLIWLPHLIGTIGEKLGVGRSIDAFVYLAIIYLIYTALVEKIKISEIRKEVTMLNRKLALKDIEKRTNA